MKHPFLAYAYCLFQATCSLASTDKAAVPNHVSIDKQSHQYQLRLNSSVFHIKGAGLNYPDGHNFEALKAAGGNSFRTWSTDYAEQELAAAKELGLMVAMGIDLKKQLHGFDYNDSAAVAAQFQWVKEQVNKYKDHPNLLVWVVANEPNLLFDPSGQLIPVNPKVYDAISDIIDYIHQVDPHHPVTYTYAGVIKSHLEVGLARTPNVDFVSVQVYGDLAQVKQQIIAANINKPVMVTEFGPLGHWEVPSTSWGQPIEEPSAIKAKSMAKRMQLGLADNSTGLIIGAFAFEWGQKQERTPTWYGMFNKDGKANARVDEMTRFWTGHYPQHRAPMTEAITINSLSAKDSVYLKSSSQAKANVVVTNRENARLTYQWKVLKEVVKISEGGAFEQEPEVIPLKMTTAPKQERLNNISFKVPDTEGAYRLFVYVYDEQGKVGNANFPFYVKEK